MGIVDSEGEEIVKYSYDVWGARLNESSGRIAGMLGRANSPGYRGDMP